MHGTGVQAARSGRADQCPSPGLHGLCPLARRLHYGRCMDAVYVGIAIAFFAASWAFVVACDRLA